MNKNIKLILILTGVSLISNLLGFSLLSEFWK